MTIFNPAEVVTEESIESAVSRAESGADLSPIWPQEFLETLIQYLEGDITKAKLLAYASKNLLGRTFADISDESKSGR